MITKMILLRGYGTYVYAQLRKHALYNLINIKILTSVVIFLLRTATNAIYPGYGF